LCGASLLQAPAGRALMGCRIAIRPVGIGLKLEQVPEIAGRAASKAGAAPE
jgi:hypothetical protein